MSNTKTAPKMEQKKEVAQAPQKGKLNSTTQKPTENRPLENEVKKLIQSFKPSAEDRIRNAENFGILTTKFEHLKTKNEELKKFKISSDGTKEQISLSNAAGFKIEVTNSKVVEEVQELMQKVLDKMLAKAQNEVQQFVI